MTEEIVGNLQYPELVSVRSVRLRESAVASVTFTDGSARDIDLDPVLYGPLFDPIRQDPKLLAQVYVDPETETLTWPDGADIDPDVLYYGGDPPWSLLAGRQSQDTSRANHTIICRSCSISHQFS